MSPEQLAVLDRWFPEGYDVVADLGWGLVDTTVLHLATGSGDVVVKAGGPDDRHVAREVEGYLTAASVWTDRGLAPRLLHHDRDARVLAVSWLPGTLADATPLALDPEVHRQAGAALALFHGQASRPSDTFEVEQVARCRELITSRHRVPADQVARLAQLLDAYQPRPTLLVPTHGDFSPRNWLVDDDGTVRVIDLGRFEWRPACSDLVRLHHRQWRGRPDLAAAFADGYGADPRTDDPPLWDAQLLREALGTVTWALAVGDLGFEAEGRQRVDDLVGPSTLPPPAGDARW